jgi:hypothetical protein
LNSTLFSSQSMFFRETENDCQHMNQQQGS